MESLILIIMRLAGVFVLYRLAIALYNISPFHPLYKFPGPRLASMTYVYEAYYDLWLDGMYTRQIKAIHDKYGPIVRINPDELHCADPDMLDEIYAGGNRPRDKWEHYAGFMIGPLSLAGLATISHDIHRVRKGALARYFSRGQMLKLEGEVRDFVAHTVDKMLRRSGNGDFDVKEVFNCLTADIISQYCFGESMGFTDQKDFEPNFGTWVKSFLSTSYLIRHINMSIPGFGALANAAPYFMGLMGEDLRNVYDQQEVQIPRHISRAISNKDDGRVFAELLESPILPESDKYMRRLAGEGFTLLIAGTETTAATLSYIVYHLLSEPIVLKRLQASLEGIGLTYPKWTSLERVPYLWAVIHEGLRLTPGISHRSARKAPDEELVYKKGSTHYTIPKGTPIGMSSMIQNRHPTLFSDPDAFKPERWLLSNGQPNYALEKKLLSFSRGSRICLGMDLAYCEMYLMINELALRVLPRTRLVNTTTDDVEYDHDCVVAAPKKGFMAVRIAVY
ncbi:benzoate 4-monooxygenase cytochrome P450 [Apiospora marii]|uniref:Benzoate 4-monooxygenase cytochrome P450 n=1 Tax=Apiospora marii TaxID=335849 RepID=A0ABR1RNI2_9PEZI